MCGSATVILQVTLHPRTSEREIKSTGGCSVDLRTIFYRCAFWGGGFSWSVSNGSWNHIHIHIHIRLSSTIRTAKEFHTFSCLLFGFEHLLTFANCELH